MDLEGWIVPPGATPHTLDETKLSFALRSIEDHGFVVLPGFFSREHLGTFAPPLISHTQQVLADLRQSGATIGVGSKLGFDEIVMRSPGRFDIPIDLGEFQRLGRQLFGGFIEAVLGEDAVCAFGGVVVSEPESKAQSWHADSLHLSEHHEPANMLNLLVSLHDVPMEMGPTQLLPGSHRLTNHLGHLRLHGSKPITSEIVYQNARNCPELIGSDEAPFCIGMPRGSVLIFDDRILHRGLANGALESRYIGYLSFRRRSFETTAYFEATRSLYRP